MRNASIPNKRTPKSPSKKMYSTSLKKNQFKSLKRSNLRGNMRKYGERTSMSYRFPSTKEMGNIGYGNTKLRRLYIFSKIGEKGSTFSRIPQVYR